jgi:hypothetical protein
MEKAHHKLSIQKPTKNTTRPTHLGRKCQNESRLPATYRTIFLFTLCHGNVLSQQSKQHTNLMRQC